MPGRWTLPARRVRLVGRDGEVALIGDRLLDGDGRLLTLTGVGGVGKTSVAVEVARRVGPAMPDGAVLVPLALTRERDAVALTCCQSLGLVEQERAPVEVLTEHLAPRAVLLVLDNAEHLLPELAGLVDGLLDDCPDLLVLVTSRAPLRIRGEAVVVVPPLSVPDGRDAELSSSSSVELFVERATAVRPGFRIQEWAASVASICRQLDGVPLAIEVAAAQVAALTPGEIEHGLGADMERRTCDGGAPRGHERVMDATLDWRHDLLAEQERAVFRRLAVFAGGWTLAAAEQVCTDAAGAGSLTSVMVSLVESSLVVREDTAGVTRFRMLHPVREYAAARLSASGEESAVSLRHANYYLTLVSPREPDWRVFTPEQLDLIAAEHGNCLAAMRFAEQEKIAPIVLGLNTSLLVFWRVRGLLRTGQRRLESALTVVGDEPSRERGLVLAGLAHYGQLLGELKESAARAHKAEMMLQAAGDVVGRRTVLGFVGDIAADTGDLDRARQCYDLARALLGDDANDLDLGFWRANIGRLSARAGDLVTAERHLELAREHFTTAPGWYRAHVLVQLARTARQRGDLHRAGALLQEALGELRAAGAAVEAIGCLDELARVALDRDDPSTAAVLFAAATRLRERTGLAMNESERRSTARDVEHTRARLTAHEFTDAWARGRALNLDQAATFATAPPDKRTESDPNNRSVPALTPREREVAALVAEGLPNSAIGARLGIAHGTARIHVERILGKLGLTSRVQIATWAVRNPQALHVR